MFVMDVSILGGICICSSGGIFMNSCMGFMGAMAFFGPTCLMRTRPPPFLPIFVIVVVAVDA